MPKKYLQLEDTRVYYDQNTGAIRLISRDPRLKGKPFQLNLLRDSESTESIYRLLEAEDLLGEKPRELPSLSYLPEIPLGSKINGDQGSDRKDLRFFIGETYDEQLLEINLSDAPHTLINGIAGSGKSTLLRSIMSQAIERPNLTVCSLDFYGAKGADSIYDSFRFQDRFTTDGSEALQLMRNIEQELNHRYEALSDRQDLSHANAVILAIDDFSALLEKNENDKHEIQNIVTHLARKGRAAGIYLFISSQRPDPSTFPGELKANFGRRILMGSSDRELQQLSLGRALYYGEQGPRPIGRGTMRLYNAQVKNFQGFVEH